MSSRIEYGVMRPNEADDVVKLILAVFDAHVAPAFDQEGSVEFRRYATPEALLERVEAGAIVIIAKQDDDLVGMVEIRDTGHLGMLFVHSEHHGGGVGASLVREVIAVCQARGQREMTVNSSINSVGFYRKQGFEAQSEEKNINGIRFVPMKRFL